MNDIEVLENYIYNKKETMKEQLVKAIENLLKDRQADKERIKELEAQDLRRDKIINEMAKYIKAGDIDEDICTTETECISENLQCEDCIKEYFTKKVEG